jgi:hypothetical protein
MNAKPNRAAFWLGVILVLIVLIAGAPLISALIAGGIAGALGCTVNEGGASACIFMGRDIGELLLDMFVLGWLAFVTLPFGAIAFGIWLLVACIVAVVRRRRHREA